MIGSVSSSILPQLGTRHNELETHTDFQWNYIENINCIIYNHIFVYNYDIIERIIIIIVFLQVPSLNWRENDYILNMSFVSSSCHTYSSITESLQPNWLPFVRLNGMIKLFMCISLTSRPLFNPLRSAALLPIIPWQMIEFRELSSTE